MNDIDILWIQDSLVKTKRPIRDFAPELDTGLLLKRKGQLETIPLS